MIPDARPIEIEFRQATRSISSRCVNDLSQPKFAYFGFRSICSSVLRKRFNKFGCLIMYRVIAASFAAIVAATVLPTEASACYNCYTPQPCATCYQQQYVAPQYRSYQETVMVSPGAVVAHRTPAQYQTVMVPRTVMVAPPGVAYEQIPPQYATRERVEMVSPGYNYYAPVAQRCASCGGYGYGGGYGY
jgi:hypothetical protein